MTNLMDFRIKLKNKPKSFVDSLIMVDVDRKISLIGKFRFQFTHPEFLDFNMKLDYSLGELENKNLLDADFDKWMLVFKKVFLLENNVYYFGVHGSNEHYILKINNENIGDLYVSPDLLEEII